MLVVDVYEYKCPQSYNNEEKKTKRKRILWKKKECGPAALSFWRTLVSPLIKKTEQDVSIFRTHKYIFNVSLSVLFDNKWNLSFSSCFIMNQENDLCYSYITRRDWLIKSPTDDRRRWSVHLVYVFRRLLPVTRFFF